MKHLIKLISQRLKGWYYFQEFKELSLLGALAFAFWFIYNYGRGIANWSLTETGFIYIIFLLVSTILGLLIKMYYRMMVIKYHEKSTEIELFKYLNKENN